MLVSVAELRTYMDVTFTNRQIDAAELVLAGLQSEMESYLGRPIELQEYEEQHVVPASFYAMPQTSFFYEREQSTTDATVEYVMPGIHLPLRNSPVVSVKSVHSSSISSQTYLGEAVRRESTISGAESTDIIIYSTNHVTFTTPSAHKFTVGQRVSLKDVTPEQYNVSAAEILDVTSTTFMVKKWTEAALPAYVSGGKATAVGTGYVVHRWGLEVFGGLPNDILTVTYTGGISGETIPTMKLMILRAATREMQNMHDDVVGVKDLNPRNVAVAETGFLEKELSVLKIHRRRRIA
jgi:hypothetical protein